MGSKKDPLEAKFEQDLQEAMALSMESHALEKFRHSRTEGKQTRFFYLARFCQSGLSVETVNFVVTYVIKVGKCALISTSNLSV